MLLAVSEIAQPDHSIRVFDGTNDLPVFSPDLEALRLPDSVRDLCSQIRRSDGLIVSSPEYVRAGFLSPRAALAISNCIGVIVLRTCRWRGSAG